MNSRRELAERLGVHERWLPSVEHAEKIAEWVALGRCHIEHQGHRNAPILVFEDGGAMELPTVRWKNTVRGWCLVSSTDVHTEEKTTHYDVCGTIDAIKSAIDGEPETGGLREFLDDVEHMIGRMKGRRDEYERFTEDVRRLIESPVRGKPVEPASGLLASLHETLARDPSAVKAERAAIFEKAEAVRDIAQHLEYSLADYRDMVMELERLCREIRGARRWHVHDENAADNRT